MANVCLSGTTSFDLTYQQPKFVFKFSSGKYVVCEGNYVRCYNSDGSVYWSNNMSIWHAGLYNDNLYVGNNYYTTKCFDKDGNILWTVTSASFQCFVYTSTYGQCWYGNDGYLYQNNTKLQYAYTFYETVSNLSDSFYYGIQTTNSGGTWTCKVHKINFNGSALVLDTSFEANSPSLLPSNANVRWAIDSNSNVYIYSDGAFLSGSTNLGNLIKFKLTGEIDTAFHIPKISKVSIKVKFDPNNKPLIISEDLGGMNSVTDSYGEIDGKGFFIVARLNTDGTMDETFHHPIQSINPLWSANRMLYPWIADIWFNSDTQYTTIGGGFSIYNSLIQFNLIDLDAHAYSGGTYNPTPTNFALTEVSGNTYNCTWNYPNDDFGCFVLKYKEWSASTYSYSAKNKFPTISPYTGHTTGATLTLPSSGTAYQIYLASVATEYPSTILHIGKIPPTGLTITGFWLDYISVSWANNETEIDGLYAQMYSGGTWVNFATLSTGATTYTYSGLSPTTVYQLRIALLYDGKYYPSATINQSTIAIYAPTGLTASTTGSTYMDLSWVNVDDGILTLYQKTTTTNYSVIWTGTTATTSYTSTGLTPSTYYQYYMTLEVSGFTFTSQVIGFATASSGLPVPKFCEVHSYTITNSTCGNANGAITITNLDYFDYYDITLTDIDGNTHTFNTITGQATGLTSNYYIITADIKPIYWNAYGRDACVITWIKIEDSNTPLLLSSTSIKPLQCQPFDVQYGRVFYNVTGLTSGHTYSFDAFTSDLSHYYSKTGITSTEDFILANASAECYWTVIRDEVNGCALLIDSKCIPSLPLFSQGGIKKLYVARWSDDLDVDFWKDSDDDYFLEFADTSFFTSTKIKQYKSLTGGTTGVTWYSIPVLPKVVQLNQKLNKLRQGFIFTTSLTVAVAKANASKWKQMSTILNPENKWIAIIQDANNNWWSFGYRFGARISTYQFKTGARGEDDGYAFEIQGIENNKILTAIDTAYVENYII